MQSLQELEIAALVKHRMGNDPGTPTRLCRRIYGEENMIEMLMTGRGYHFFYQSESCDLDILWSRNRWNLALRLKWTETTSEVNASQEKWLGSEWAEVFALDFTQATFYEFRIQDFRLEPSKRKVTFHGELGSKEGDSGRCSNSMIFHWQ